jgi:hypothetical protein
MMEENVKTHTPARSLNESMQALIEDELTCVQAAQIFYPYMVHAIGFGIMFCMMTNTPLVFCHLLSFMVSLLLPESGPFRRDSTFWKVFPEWTDLGARFIKVAALNTLAFCAVVLAVLGVGLYRSMVKEVKAWKAKKDE